MDWKDTTSYSRNETERVPTTWSAECGRFRLVITRSHIHYKGRWIFHLHPGVLDCHDLLLKGDVPPMDAMTKAKQVAAGVLQEALTVLDTPVKEK
jgi:hypothetical protein